MRILYIITGLGLGGAEKVVIDLAESMHKRGHQVKIAYLTGNIIIRPKFNEIEIIGLKLNSLKDMISSSIIYNKLIISFKPDVVHAHMVHANLFTRLNRLFYKVPKLINSAHSNNEGGELRMYAYKLTNFLADVTTNVSQNAVYEFEKKKAVPRGQMLTIYNGINLNNFKPKAINRTNFIESLNLNPNKKILLSVGRLTEPKDYPNLIRSLCILKTKSITNFQLIIAGEGILRVEIERIIQDLNLKDEITLLGNRKDIADLMNLADIYILPSKFEGFGLVVAEAMACETFVIATNCGGVSEVMGETGILVPPQNSELLAQAIEHSLSLSDEEIIQNGKKARLRVEQLFSLETSINKWLEIYEAK